MPVLAADASVDLKRMPMCGFYKGPVTNGNQVTVSLGRMIARLNVILNNNQGVMNGAYNYSADMVYQWPFGHGMSYTAFKYSNMTVSAQEFDSDDVIKVTVDVTNVGARTGKESVLLYSSDLYASCTPDVRRLRDFDKVELESGETVSSCISGKHIFLWSDTS